MKKSLLLIVISIISFQLSAKEISIDRAKEIAISFLNHNSESDYKSNNIYNLKYLGDITDPNSQQPVSFKSLSTKIPNLYFFSITDTAGFIIIAADDAAVPVLGYSFNSKIRKDNIPADFLKWIEGYKQQINFLKTNSIQQTREIKELWDCNSLSFKSLNKSVSPLVSTKWNQAPYFNDKCPYDYNYNELSVTGCPATAMAQIMKYWKYPSQGIGFHSYEHKKYGTLSANFGSVSYNWNAMPDVVNSTNDAVALLMYHCGVAVEMNYNVAAEGGSGSYVIIDPYNRYPESQTVEYAFKTYFGYDKSIQGLERENYTDSQWKNILKTDLDAGRPIQYAGYGQGGHTFVCDGYDQNDYFHMNWGWGGYYDGFFLLDALNPGEGGIGAGGHSYNDGQQALIGIKPSESSSPENPSKTTDLQIYEDVTPSSYSIKYCDAFSVHADLLNTGNSTFNGDYCAAVFDENDAFIDFVEIISNASLQSNFHYTNGVTFSNKGMVAMMPGTYHIYLFARPTDGEWVCLSADPSDYFTQSFATVKVFYENNISLYSKINIQTEQIYTGGSFSANVDIANFSYYDFNGSIDLSLYDLNGDFVETIEEKTNQNLPYNSHYIGGLDFYSNSLKVKPGTYLLAVMHKWNNEDYFLTGSTNDYINPVKIIVKDAPVYKDIYEYNDDVDYSYQFDLSFINNKAEIQTTGSTIHVGNDWDFYSVKLDEGYNYTVNARLNDAYNSGDGKQYSVDGLFLYSTDGYNWSDVYDDIMPSGFNVQGGTTLYIVISPYFLGETGTYLFDISIQRSGTNSNPNLKENSTIYIFPNPCNTSVYCQSDGIIQKCCLYNVQGKLLIEYNISDKLYTFDLSSFVKGVYFLNFYIDNKIYTKKLVKH